MALNVNLYRGEIPLRLPPPALDKSPGFGNTRFFYFSEGVYLIWPK